MARRLTTNQEIAGSIPASVNKITVLFGHTTFCFFFFGLHALIVTIQAFLSVVNMNVDSTKCRRARPESFQHSFITPINSTVFSMAA